MQKRAGILRVLRVVVMIVLTTQKTVAQQTPMYSQYMFNMLNINPAYAGSRGTTNITGVYRHQWVGIKHSPRIASLALDMATNNKRMGLGFQLYDDILGPERTTGFNVAYAYRMRITNSGTLSLGLQGGVLNYRTDYQSLNIIDQGDPVFSIDLSGFLPAFAAGIYYNSDFFYTGLSIPALLQTKIDNNNQGNIASITARELHLYGTMGLVFRMSDNVVLKPSALVKVSSGAPIETDININAWLHDVFSIGFSYRTGDAYVGMVELQMGKQLRLGYAYDKPFTELASFTSGSHEIMLRYELGGKTPSKAVSPRYF